MSDEEISDELFQREAKLAVIEKEIAGLQFRLQEFRTGHLLRSGEVNRIRAAEDFKRSLRENLNKKMKHRDLMFAEVKKAKERLALAQEEQDLKLDLQE